MDEANLPEKQEVELSDEMRGNLQKVEDAVFAVYEEDGKTAAGVEQRDIDLGKEHVRTVSRITEQLGKEAKLTQDELYVACVAAKMHDALKYNHERANGGERLLLHHLDSAVWANEWLEAHGEEIGLDEEQRNQVVTAILEHEGMPFVNGVLRGTIKARKEDAGAAKIMAAIEEQAAKLGLTEKDVILGGKINEFVRPSNLISASVYAADLLGPGSLIHMEKGKREVGAFDKYVSLNLAWGKDLMASVESAADSVRNNVAELQGTAAAAEAMSEYIAERYPPEVSKVLKQFGDKYGSRLVDRVDALIELLKQTPDESASEEIEFLNENGDLVEAAKNFPDEDYRETYEKELGKRKEAYRIRKAMDRYYSAAAIVSGKEEESAEVDQVETIA